MPRQFGSRWFAIVLTLCVLLASNAALPRKSFGSWDGKDPSIIGDDAGRGGSGSESGDPDAPSGPDRRSVTPGRGARSGYTRTAVPVSGASGALRVWTWRIQVVLRSLRTR